jgi:hypothetical protein
MRQARGKHTRGGGRTMQTVTQQPEFAEWLKELTRPNAMARRWNHRIKIRHLFTDEESHEAIQVSMNAIADVLDADTWFVTFLHKSKFHSIPEGNDIVGPVDYANKLLDLLYDFCDNQRIWVE